MNGQKKINRNNSRKIKGKVRVSITITIRILIMQGKVRFNNPNHTCKIIM